MELFFIRLFAFIWEPEKSWHSIIPNVYEPILNWHRNVFNCIMSDIQGLTQTFMSSGPQDHQLRGSGGPTIFLVVLTTTTLVNLATICT